jgi:hypothetical protein
MMGLFSWVKARTSAQEATVEERLTPITTSFSKTRSSLAAAEAELMLLIIARPFDSWNPRPNPIYTKNKYQRLIEIKIRTTYPISTTKKAIARREVG